MRSLSAFAVLALLAVPLAAEAGSPGGARVSDARARAEAGRYLTRGSSARVYRSPVGSFERMSWIRHLGREVPGGSRWTDFLTESGGGRTMRRFAAVEGRPVLLGTWRERKNGTVVFDDGLGYRRVDRVISQTADRMEIESTSTLAANATSASGEMMKPGQTQVTRYVVSRRSSGWGALEAFEPDGFLLGGQGFAVPIKPGAETSAAILHSFPDR